jgi:hypothetical protein
MDNSFLSLLLILYCLRYAAHARAPEEYCTL